MSKSELIRPTEGVPFEVDPLAIDQRLFQAKRDDSRQEETRQWILEAFAEAKANPEKYGKRFYTLRPERTWDVKTYQQLEEYASKLGDHEADWVEQGFEFAQRIQNGEKWEDVCNKADTAPWYRAIIWKNGFPRSVGGARCSLYNYPVPEHDCSPASFVQPIIDSWASKVTLNYYSVPLVVLYELHKNGRLIRPKEGVLFEVNPLAIDQKLFQQKRNDESQERTRQWILESFAEAKANSKKYGKRFYTLRPEKTWDVKTEQELKEYASKIGDHEADWVEQGFELAQRIYNGEIWEDVCNEADTAPWFRAIIWKDGFIRLVGGARSDYYDHPASYVYRYGYHPLDNLISVVPLVVLYK